MRLEQVHLILSNILFEEHEPTTPGIQDDHLVIIP
jgi:hypothetical protein